MFKKKCWKLKSRMTGGPGYRTPLLWAGSITLHSRFNVFANGVKQQASVHKQIDCALSEVCWFSGLCNRRMPERTWLRWKHSRSVERLFFKICYLYQKFDFIIIITYLIWCTHHLFFGYPRSGCRDNGSLFPVTLAWLLVFHYMGFINSKWTFKFEAEI